MPSRSPFSAKQADYFSKRVEELFGKKMALIAERFPLLPERPEELVSFGLVPPKSPKELNELRSKIDLTRRIGDRYTPTWSDIYDVDSYLKKHQSEISEASEKRRAAEAALKAEKTRVLDLAFLEGSNLAEELRKLADWQPPE